ncbi:hypothetical protein DICA2_D06480 [Diutina catenulata]
MKILQLFVYLAVAAATVTTITSSTIINRKGMPEMNIDDIYVYKNAYMSIINNQLTRFSNQLKIYDNAAFWDSSIPRKKGKQVVSSAFNHLYNYGLVSIYSPLSTTAFNYDIDLKSKFYNKGWMFLGGGSEQVPKVNIRSPHWENWGVVSVYNEGTPQGELTLGMAGKNALNKGSICLNNMVFKQMNKVYGCGCIRAQANSLVHIRNHADPIYTDQTIVLDSPSAHILTTNYNAKYTYLVAGFGKGNFIASEGQILHFNYDSNKGILSIYHDQAKKVAVNFKIGKGYLPTQFKIATAEVGGVKVAKNAIKYSGTVPLSATPIPKSYCPACPVRPEQPGYKVPEPEPEPTTSTSIEPGPTSKDTTMTTQTTTGGGGDGLTTITSNSLPTNGGGQTTVTIPTDSDGKPDISIPSTGVTTITVTKDPDPLPSQSIPSHPESCIIEYVTATLTATEYWLVLECPSCT